MPATRVEPSALRLAVTISRLLPLVLLALLCAAAATPGAWLLLIPGGVITALELAAGLRHIGGRSLCFNGHYWVWLDPGPQAAGPAEPLALSAPVISCCGITLLRIVGDSGVYHLPLLDAALPNESRRRVLLALRYGGGGVSTVSSASGNRFG